MTKTPFALERLKRDIPEGKYPWDMTIEEFCSDAANKYIGYGCGESDDVLSYVWSHLDKNNLHPATRYKRDVQGDIPLYIHPGIYMEKDEEGAWKELERIKNELDSISDNWYSYEKNGGLWLLWGNKKAGPRLASLLDRMESADRHKTQTQKDRDARIMPQAWHNWQSLARLKGWK